MKSTSPRRLASQTYSKGILAGDRVMLSRAITLIESSIESDQHIAAEIMSQCLAHRPASYRVGISGVPGVGKSTFINQFGLEVIRKGYSVAVLAVDPSSTQSHGSILGDKTRMYELSNHPQAYVRPSPTSGTLGGVASMTRDVALLCESAGFDVILIETVGVGQSEVVVREMVDHFLLLLLPHAGDDLQGIKRGIMERTDTLVIHKADGKLMDNARLTQRQYQQAMQLFTHPAPDWEVAVKLVSSTEALGIAEIWDHLHMFRTQMKSSGYWQHQRQLQDQYWLEKAIQDQLTATFLQDPIIKSELEKLHTHIQQKTLSATYAARQLISNWLSRKR